MAKSNSTPYQKITEQIISTLEECDANGWEMPMTRTYLSSTTDPVAERVRLLEGEHEILPGLRVWPMPGHTWGQQAVRFDDEKGVVCFPGDVMPTVHHVAPAFGMGYDMLPYQNMRSKLAFLSRASKEDWRLVLDHEPGEAVVRVIADEQKPNRYRLEAA